MEQLKRLPEAQEVRNCGRPDSRKILKPNQIAKKLGAQAIQSVGCGSVCGESRAVRTASASRSTVNGLLTKPMDQ